MALTDLVNISVAVKDAAPSTPNFGTPMILTSQITASGKQRFLADATATTALTTAGAADGTAAYRMAQAGVAQPVHCQDFLVGKRAHPNVQTLTLVPGFVTGQTYTMTVYGYNGQTANCQTTYSAPVYVPPVTTPYVSLSQIPYTGFDLGTVGNSIYWASLIAFALAAGYLMIYFKGGMVAFAGSMVPSFAKASKGEPTRAYSAPIVASKTVEVEPTIVAQAPIIEETSYFAKASQDTPVLASLPVAQTSRPTMDSMSFSNHNGAPRLVISRS